MGVDEADHPVGVDVGRDGGVPDEQPWILLHGEESRDGDHPGSGPASVGVTLDSGDVLTLGLGVGFRC
jgi:hypothetical protein